MKKTKRFRSKADKDSRRETCLKKIDRLDSDEKRLINSKIRITHSLTPKILVFSCNLCVTNSTHQIDHRKVDQHNN